MGEALTMKGLVKGPVKDPVKGLPEGLVEGLAVKGLMCLEEARAVCHLVPKLLDLLEAEQSHCWRSSTHRCCLQALPPADAR